MALKLVESRLPTEDEKNKAQVMYDDYDWFSKHSEEIWEKYKGKYIAVANQSLLVGDTLDEVLKKAKEKAPDKDPFIKHILYKRRIWVYDISR